MKREVNTRDRTKARKNARGKVAIGFNLHLIGWEGSKNFFLFFFFEQSKKVAKEESSSVSQDYFRLSNESFYKFHLIPSPIFNPPLTR